MKQIPLTHGLSALVDDTDYAAVSRHKWHASQQRCGLYYACASTNGKTVRMHRLIMQPPDGIQIDHIDSDGLNNCRANLRLCSHSQNARHSRKTARTTSSKYKGVYWDGQRRKWRAQIYYTGRETHLGRFSEECQAAVAYNEAAIEYYGEYAILNDLQRRCDVG